MPASHLGSGALPGNPIPASRGYGLSRGSLTTFRPGSPPGATSRPNRLGAHTQVVYERSHRRRQRIQVSGLHQSRTSSRSQLRRRCHRLSRHRIAAAARQSSVLPGATGHWTVQIAGCERRPPRTRLLASRRHVSTERFSRNERSSSPVKGGLAKLIVHRPWPPLKAPCRRVHRQVHDTPESRVHTRSSKGGFDGGSTRSTRARP